MSSHRDNGQRTPPTTLPHGQKHDAPPQIGPGLSRANHRHRLPVCVSSLLSPKETLLVVGVATNLARLSFSSPPSLLHHVSKVHIFQKRSQQTDSTTAKFETCSSASNDVTTPRRVVMVRNMQPTLRGCPPWSDLLSPSSGLAPPPWTGELASMGWTRWQSSQPAHTSHDPNGLPRPAEILNPQTRWEPLSRLPSQ